ncbi:MAG: DUF2125 domain-containing protein, partial [Gemmobacter sp.]|nr:DUF2125 domain-containing protein [Gemmobacter sp.]
MRVLVWAVVVLGAVWCGWWFIGARGAEQVAAEVERQLAARGLEVSQAGVTVAGFPSRFDLTVNEPEVFDPASGIGWQAPFAQVLTLSYAPWKLIAALPEEQVVMLPGQVVTVGSTRMRASLFLRPRPGLPLDRFDAVAEGVSLRSDARWSLGFASANLSVIGQEGGAQLAVRLLDLVPDQRMMAPLAGRGLPGTIARADLLADLSLSEALGLRGGTPQVMAAELREADLVWGRLELKASGRVGVDDEGFAEGTIHLTVHNWQDGLAAAEAA